MGFIDKKVRAQLPQELITEILKRVPVKSLLRFRCVSKSFSSIIDGRDFNNSLMNRSVEDNGHLNLIFPTSMLVYSTYDSAKLRASDFQLKRGIELSGYCNGVFLLLLWNPSTHQRRVLPCLPFDPDLFSLDFCFGVGFGYDSSQDDYKVVVLEPFSHQFPPEVVEYRVWVFGLRLNSWRQVVIDSQAKDEWYVYGLRFGCFAHGNLHWLCGNDTEDWQIVAFDLAKETLSILATPVYKPNGRIDGDLHVSGGCLFVSFYTITLEKEACLYVRKKDEVGFTWSLLYSVSTNQLPSFLKISYFEYMRVLGYSREGDKILLDLHPGHVVSYDIKEKRFQLTDIILLLSHSRARSFVESLVDVRAPYQA